MADKQEGSLTAAGALDGTEGVVVVQGSNSRGATTGHIKYAGHVGALVKKSANLTGQNTTGDVAVAWDAETYDYGTWHDTVTNNSRLTVPSGVSRVRVMGQVTLANVTASNIITATIRKNGSAAYDGVGQVNTANGGTTVVTQVETAILEVSAGDYFELYIKASSDTSIDYTAAGCWFAIEKISE